MLNFYKNCSMIMDYLWRFGLYSSENKNKLPDKRTAIKSQIISRRIIYSFSSFLPEHYSHLEPHISQDILFVLPILENHFGHFNWPISWILDAMSLKTCDHKFLVKRLHQHFVFIFAFLQILCFLLHVNNVFHAWIELNHWIERKIDCLIDLCACVS